MLIQTTNVNLIYKDGKSEFQALKNINLELPEKGLCGILGPSGSGKTSLLYALSGIKKVSSGTILFHDRDISSKKFDANKLRRYQMGFVFQMHFLINYLNVTQNILVGAVDYQKAKKEVQTFIDRLGLTGLEKRKPFALSGGQRQRVAIARALINRPRILFLDEPTASLDKKNGDMVMNLLAEIAKEKCVVVVTHDPEILKNADKIFKMSDGELISSEVLDQSQE